MEDATSGYVCLPGESEVRWMGSTSTHFLATGEQSGGEFCLVDELGHRGDTVPLHRHDDVESFYVLEGEMTLFVGDGAGVTGPAGTFAHIPGGTVHGFRVESETARYLILTTPRHGDFYKAITVASAEGGHAPEDPSVDGAVLKQAAGDYGIEVVGPLPD